MPDQPIPVLKPHIVKANKDVVKILLEARRAIEKEIAFRMSRPRISSLASQRALYDAIESLYKNLENQIEKWAKGFTGDLVDDFQALALEDLGGGANLVKFDEQYIAEVFSRIHPANQQNIAAVYTNKMLASDISQLRALTLDVTRLGAVAGLSQPQLAKELRKRWENLAASGGLNSFNFIDRSGRRWDNSNYFSMLVRTTAGRVHRDSYIDTLARNGKDLAQINNSGTTSCPACTAFDGVIVSISGANKDYPSATQAKDGGVFHPNCLCYYTYIDEDRDAEEIKEQAGLPNPVTDDRKEWLDYAKRYQEAKKAPTAKAPSALRQPSKKNQKASQEAAQKARES